ncbi:RNA polymerase sigma factor [uncultured Acetobacteroides sp.]|uniref:RNA polymerase sigma factor n=1 Tax=uncultured Acetobacteroides sp. TaxID=1760811 RepID=UPI0029F47E52|nr:RNA polymerase sigma factor [uncultured Acetobacteroides sp.]
MTPHEYNKCVDLYADSIYRFAVKMLKDGDLCHDIVQDTFEKLWIRVGEIAFEKAKSYLFTTVYHATIDHIRKRQRIGEDMGLERVTDSVSTVSPDLKEILQKGLSLLPEDQKSVILLRDYEGYSYDEIGNITGLSESQVKVYIYRARLFLKNYIGKIENVI